MMLAAVILDVKSEWQDLAKDAGEFSGSTKLKSSYGERGSNWVSGFWDLIVIIDRKKSLSLKNELYHKSKM